MKVPKEFRQLAISFYPGSKEEVGDPTMEEWVDWVVQNFCTRDETRIAKAFLDELLDGTHDDAELQLAWDMTSPSYQFAGEGAMRWWLTLIATDSDRRTRRPACALGEIFGTSTGSERCASASEAAHASEAA